MSEPAHSPLPWRLAKAGADLVILDANDVIVIEPDYASDACLIVRAVNSHEELIKAAKHIVSSCCIDPVVWPRTISALQAAIANAEKAAP